MFASDSPITSDDSSSTDSYVKLLSNKNNGTTKIKTESPKARSNDLTETYDDDDNSTKRSTIGMTPDLTLMYTSEAPMPPSITDSSDESSGISREITATPKGTSRATWLF